MVFACCLAVKGATRSIICDLQRQDFIFIPNDLYEILVTHKGITIDEIKLEYQNEYNDIIQEYFDFLEANEYIFYTDNPSSFPEIDLRWDEPSVISNVIIDLNEHSAINNWDLLINDIEELGCKHIQIRCFNDRDLSFFEDILKRIEGKRIISVSIITKYQNCLTKDSILSFCNKYPRVDTIYFHSAPSTEVLLESSTNTGHVFFTNEIINSDKHCGIVSPEYFSINISTFTESQKYNTCLNRKISIDEKGMIKNCPSMLYSYGNINEISIKEVLKRADFKKLWGINKDQIEVCKDCEFRYICTDCRAFIQDKNNIYSKPLKCGYNPYTAEWETENIANNMLYGS